MTSFHSIFDTILLGCFIVSFEEFLLKNVVIALNVWVLFEFWNIVIKLHILQVNRNNGLIQVVSPPGARHSLISVANPVIARQPT